jgi:hypothetical protein
LTKVTYRIPLDGVTYRQVRDVVQSTRTVVIVFNDEREKYVLLEDECLWLLGVPLGPVDPKALVSIGIQVVGESDNIIFQFAPWTKRVYEVRRVSLESKTSAAFQCTNGLEVGPTDPMKGVSFKRFQTWGKY